jgi:hydroxyacylglutathione hydrolase
VLDVRGGPAFGAGHVPGSLHVGLAGVFAPWSGTLVPADRPVVLVAEGEDEVREAVVRLARVGIERVEGYLAGGILSWQQAGRPLGALDAVTPLGLRERMAAEPRLQVIDVRRPSEFADGHVPGAVNVPLDTLAAAPLALDAHAPTAVVCAGGYRSSAGASLLLRRGFDALVDVAGGTTAWVKAGLPTEPAPRAGGLSASGGGSGS